MQLRFHSPIVDKLLDTLNFRLHLILIKMSEKTEEPQTSDTGRDTLKAGTVVANRYTIVRPLGQGGMGSVYLVEDKILDSENVAIKILHREFSFNKQHTRRFLREVKLMHKVNHPNVARTFDVGADGNLVYFTMEYIKGTPLDVLIDTASFPTQNTVSIVSQMCEGIEAIHDTGIVHRDLKPGNIILLDDGTVKITDFGVARPQKSDLTAHNEIVGSAAYVAPEIWEGDIVAPSVDLYSLGIIFYEIATGTVPFDAEAPAALMRLHLQSTPRAPKDINKDTPAWFNRLILKLLAKSPNDRFKSAGAIIEYINQYDSRGYVFNSGNSYADLGPCVNPDFLLALEEVSKYGEEGNEELSELRLPSKETFSKAPSPPKAPLLKTISNKIRQKISYISKVSYRQFIFTLLTVLCTLTIAVLSERFGVVFGIEPSKSAIYLLFSGIPKSFAAILILSLPVIALSSLSRSIIQVLRAAFISLTFMVLGGSLLTINLLNPLSLSYEVVSFETITIGGEAAMEQLAGIVALSPMISDFGIGPVDQSFSILWSDYSPIYANPIVMLIAFSYLFLVISVTHTAIKANSKYPRFQTTVIIVCLVLGYTSGILYFISNNHSFGRELHSLLQIPISKPILLAGSVNWFILFTLTLVSVNFNRKRNSKPV